MCDRFEPWLLVSFEDANQTFERCAYLLGIESYNWPRNQTLAAAKEASDKYDVGEQMTIWTPHMRDRCIVGYGDQALLSKKVDSLLSARQHSYFLLESAGAMAVLSCLLSIWCGLFRSVEPAEPNYSPVPTELKDVPTNEVAIEN